MNVAKNGFTFIELLITIGIVSITLPIIFGLFFINLQSQARISALQEVKRNGDVALITMQSLIRQNALSVHSGFPATVSNQVCQTSGSSYTSPTGTLYFRDRLGNAFGFYIENDKIASDSAKEATAGTRETFYLSNDKVEVSNWTLSCDRGSTFGLPLVNFSFDVDTADGEFDTELPPLHYYTKVKLRN